VILVKVSARDTLYAIVGRATASEATGTAPNTNVVDRDLGLEKDVAFKHAFIFWLSQT
jgi:hypothetical protein